MGTVLSESAETALVEVARLRDALRQPMCYDGACGDMCKFYNTEWGSCHYTGEDLVSDEIEVDHCVYWPRRPSAGCPVWRDERKETEAPEA